MVTDCRPLIAAAKALYQLDGHGVGGCLHIVLDDGNIADDHIRFCRDWAAAGKCRTDGQPCQAGVALAEQLLQCSKTQRGKIYKAV